MDLIHVEDLLSRQYKKLMTVPLENEGMTGIIKDRNLVPFEYHDGIFFFISTNGHLYGFGLNYYKFYIPLRDTTPDPPEITIHLPKDEPRLYRIGTYLALPHKKTSRLQGAIDWLYNGWKKISRLIPTRVRISY